MHRIAGAIGRVILILISLGLGIVPALIAEASAAEPTPSAAALPPGLSAAQAHDLLTVLQDPAQRAHLVSRLQALEKVLPATATPTPATSPAPAKPQTASTAASTAASPTDTVIKAGLVAQLATTAPRWVEGLLGQAASLRHVVRGIPAAADWLASILADDATRWALVQVGVRVILVLALAGVVWFALRRLLRRRRATLGALAAREATFGTPAVPGTDTDAQTGQQSANYRAYRRPRVTAAARDQPLSRPEVAHRLWTSLWGSARLIALASLAFVVDLLPVAAFTAVGYLLALLLAPAAPHGTVFAGPLAEAGTFESLVLIVIDACAIFGAIRCVARLLVAPDLPALRPVPVSDAAAIGIVRWVARLAAVAIFGMAALDMALLLDLDPAAALALRKLVLLVVDLMVIVIVLRNRRAVAAHLRAPKRRTGVFASVLTGLADIWHIIAVFVILLMWLVSAVGWHGGYTRVLQFVGSVIIVGVAGRLLVEGLLLALRHALHLTEPPDGADPRPVEPNNLTARIARYYPVLHLTIHAIVVIVGILVLLELWGIGSVGWLTGTALGWQMVSAAISIAITLCLAAVAWEWANVAVDRHLDRLSEQAQVARAVRVRTLLPIMRAALAITIVTIVGLTTLSQIGVNIAPLLAGAGIVGVAIGFGSQKLVQDVITGIFLLLENAMQVGDSVTLAGVSGTVENLSIRTIRLRAGDGSLYVIPFSSVTMINNTNRGLGNAAVSVTIGAREDTDAVGEVLKAIVVEMRQDPAFKDNMLSDLQLWGVDKVDGAAALLVGQIVCTDSGRWGVQREFNRRYKKRFAELGIEIPNPTQTLLLRRFEPASPHPAAPSEAEPTTATVKESPPPSALGQTG
jgi:small-conductance mechanosensitive channel